MENNALIKMLIGKAQKLNNPNKSWADNPNNWDNKLDNWQNNPQNWANSPKNWKNDPRNLNAKIIYDSLGNALGYAVEKGSGKGVNFYDFYGNRTGYYNY